MQGLKWITGAALLAATVLTAPAAHAELGVDWEVAATQHPFSGRQGTAFVEFDGKLWGIGGVRYNACTESVWTGSEWGWECIRYEDLYYSDVWFSEDGSNWTKVLDALPFEISTLFDYQTIAFNGQLYLFQNDRLPAYRTTDGREWEQLSSEVWGDAYVVFESKLIHISNVRRATTDGVNWTRLPDNGVLGPFGYGGIRVTVYNGSVYAFQSQRVWRTTDFYEWTELEGNTDELDVFSERDVNLFAFAGKLWLGGGFIFPGASGPRLGGSLWSSLDGANWTRVIADYRLTREEGTLLPFNGAIYTLAGRGPQYAYRSVASCDELLGGEPHTADVSGCGTISLSELLRVIQLFSTQGYDCDDNTEDGYAARANSHKIGSEGSPDGEGATEGLIEDNVPPCDRHSADFEDPAWRITLPELLRMVQLYNAGAYHCCLDSEDGFCPGK
ncbi:MAG: hypothetical protein GC168_06855 [Candidatus Hydrogenedens sp.]|nr:hypothetical protein [Candidatus Hydrogenedens sp.]